MKYYDEIIESLIDNEKDVKKYVPVAGAVICKYIDGILHVLLIQRSEDDNWPNAYEIPRGKCDCGDNEKLTDCCRRETKEETGLDIKIIKFLDKFDYIADGGTRKSTQHNFLAILKDENQEVIFKPNPENGVVEHQDFMWVSEISIATLSVMPELNRTIAKVLSLENPIVNYQLNIENYLEKIQRQKN